MKRFNISALFLALSIGRVAAFTPFTPRIVPSTQRFETAEETSSETTKAAAGLPMPMSYSEMVKQVASAMRDAAAAGTNRQILRVCLPRDLDNQKLGTYSEGLMDVASQNIILVPPGK